MRFSVLIPAYNAARTVGHAVESALAQTLPAHEIIVADDGSTDDTAGVLAAFGDRIIVVRHPNQGVAQTRNELCRRAAGDHLAFLDADDLWHPRYLDVQAELLGRHPTAIASFTWHVDFEGEGGLAWAADAAGAVSSAALIEGVEFLRRYNETPLRFQMSCFCIAAATMRALGPEPFLAGASGADDTHVHNLLPLLGPVVATPAQLAAYRIVNGSISDDRLRMALLVDEVFRDLAPRYRSQPDARLGREFAKVTASRKRNSGKYLMGAGRAPEARRRFRDSLRSSPHPLSLGKSAGLLAVSLLPSRVYSRWPRPSRAG